MGGPGEAGREMSRACLWCRCVWSREGLGALPGGLRAGKQALLLGADTMAPLFTVVGRSSSVRRMLWGGLPGGRQGHRDALPDTGLQPALSVGEREEKISSLVVNSPGKCAKRGTGTVWKTKAMFHLISIVGESRKCLLFIHTLRVVWLGEVNQALCKFM